MNVIRTITNSEPNNPFNTLIDDIFKMKAAVMAEGRSAEAEKASRKASQAKKKQKAASRKKADEKRGSLDTDKAKKVVKKHVDTGEFKNSESFAATPEDAHLHTDGKCNDSSLRHNKPAGSYVKVGDLKKNPCDKRYPKFSGKREKARTAGALRQAYAHHDQKAIKELSVVAKSQGMKNVTGASWNERPECKDYQHTKDASKLPNGWTAKMCKPHGQGGGDEWLRKHHSDSSGTDKGSDYHKGHDTHKAQEAHKDVKHEPSARHRSFLGASKVYHKGHKKAGQLVMPKSISPEEKAHMLGHWNKDTSAKKAGEGGKQGELARGARRTLSKAEQEKRTHTKAPTKEGSKVVLAKAKWHRLTKDKTGKSTFPRHVAEDTNFQRSVKGLHSLRKEK